jgi:hypothetical protein
MPRHFPRRLPRRLPSHLLRHLPRHLPRHLTQSGDTGDEVRSSVATDIHRRITNVAEVAMEDWSN